MIVWSIAVGCPQLTQTYRMRNPKPGCCHSCGKPALDRYYCTLCQRKKTEREAKRFTLPAVVSRLVHDAKKSSKRGHRARAIACTVSTADLKALWAKQNGICAVSGLPMTLERGVNAVSMDRIDSTGGYTIDNIMLVCRWVNLGRGATPIHEFTEHVLKPLTAATKTPLGSRS